MSIPFRSWDDLKKADATTEYIEHSLLDVLSTQDQKKIIEWQEWLKKGYELNAISPQLFSYFVNRLDFYLNAMNPITGKDGSKKC